MLLQRDSENSFDDEKEKVLQLRSGIEKFIHLMF